MTKLFWLGDAEWAKVEPLLPRGRRGAHRVERMFCRLKDCHRIATRYDKLARD
jgi:transposase